MNRSMAVAVGSVLGAAVVGNGWVSKDDLAWLDGLKRPRMQIPLPAFATVGAIYYVILGIVIYRACERRDKTSTRLALTVLVLNEVWNVFFYRFRSTRNAFAGILLFLLPLGALQRAVRGARGSDIGCRACALHHVGGSVTTCRGRCPCGK